MKEKVEARQERVEKANELIRCIASCGRKFFHGKDKISFFELKENGSLWYHDKYTGGIYMNRREWKTLRFTEGGTMRRLVHVLRDYILRAEAIPNHFGPWPNWWGEGDPWEYGEDIEIVRKKAIELKIMSQEITEER